RDLHVVDPDRQGGGAAGFAAAEVFRLVETDPGDGDDLRVVAAEPGVDIVVGGAGLAGEVAALELEGAGGGAGPDDVLHHRIHHEGVALVDDPGGRLAGHRRVDLGDGVAGVVEDF